MRRYEAACTANHQSSIINHQSQRGGVGCGCLLTLLIVVIVLSGVSIHPFSLRLIGGFFRYTEPIVTADAVFVPRFPEDKNGEVYMEAFQQYWNGNGKVIWIEGDRMLGFDLKDLVGRMAKERGIKGDIIRKIDLEEDDTIRAQKVREIFAKLHYRKVIIVVPEYAARRFHSCYDGKEREKGTVFMVKPVAMSYFMRDSWWKNGPSRGLVMHELYETASQFAKGLGGGIGNKIKGMKESKEKKSETE